MTSSQNGDIALPIYVDRTFTHRANVEGWFSVKFREHNKHTLWLALCRYAWMHLKYGILESVTISSTVQEATHIFLLSVIR
jgi:hypothetical protein